ncbi:hypothetical protein OROMI_029456 [Orobanche minor]
MMWDERYDLKQRQDEEEESDEDSNINFDFFSILSKPKDYYKVLEVDPDASEEIIRTNYIRLALKWHPDKQKNEDTTTSKFQEINEAYQGVVSHRSKFKVDEKATAVLNSTNSLLFLAFINFLGLCFSKSFENVTYVEFPNFVGPVLSDPVTRREYDKKGMNYTYDSNITEYLSRYQSLILTCNGLGMKCSIW